MNIKKGSSVHLGLWWRISPLSTFYKFNIELYLLLENNDSLKPRTWFLSVVIRINVFARQQCNEEALVRTQIGVRRLCHENMKQVCSGPQAGRSRSGTLVHTQGVGVWRRWYAHRKQVCYVEGEGPRADDWAWMAPLPTSMRKWWDEREMIFPDDTHHVVAGWTSVVFDFSGPRC